MRTHADYIYDGLKYSLADTAATERKELFELIAEEYNMETGETKVTYPVKSKGTEDNSKEFVLPDNIKSLVFLPSRHI